MFKSGVQLEQSTSCFLRFAMKSADNVEWPRFRSVDPLFNIISKEQLRPAEKGATL